MICYILSTLLEIRKLNINVKLLAMLLKSDIALCLIDR